MLRAVGVEAQCEEGNVRLVNGSSPLEGRVEVCIDRQWGTVCDFWNPIPNAHVVCWQLGYLRGSDSKPTYMFT